MTPIIKEKFQVFQTIPYSPINLLKGMESNEYEIDKEELSLLKLPLIPPLAMSCQSESAPPCSGVPQYEISMSCGLRYIKCAKCEGMIATSPDPTKQSCTVNGNTKTIFVKD